MTKNQSIDFFSVKTDLKKNFYNDIKKHEEIEHKSKPKKSFWDRWGDFIILLSVIIILPAILILSLKHPKIRKHVKNFIIYLRDSQHIGTYALFILFTVAMSTILSNTTIPNFISGMIYGTGRGSILTSIAVLISGSISFLMSRFLIRDRIKNIIQNNTLLKKYYNIISDTENTLNNKSSLELVFLSRLAPVSPYHTFSYFWGISDIKYWVFLIGSLGVLPSVIFETYIGSQFEDIEDIFKKKKKIIHVVIMIVISVIIGIIVDRIIKKIIKKKESKTSKSSQTRKQ